MKIYLVGGAVRDKLLGRPVKERDWVVVGASVEAMLALGYQQVGKDFPVFLHPKTKEEYALARVERKVGKGYTGFSFDASSNVTLEEDLRRRDLTINAMAESESGELIDPYQGKMDLEQKIFRHVSAAFAEDPVRILRLARFSARLADFTLAPETRVLMRQMVDSGEVNALVPERVWKELERALGEGNPPNFFKVLAECGALSVLFPEIELSGDGVRALARAVELSEETPVRFAALFYGMQVDGVVSFCERYRVPREYRELAMLVAGYANVFQRQLALSAAEVVDFFYAADAFRREPRFYQFLMVCEACTGVSSSLFKQRLDVLKEIDIQQIIVGLKGEQIAERVRRERIDKLKNLRA